jgi:hypothetical protein
VVVPAVVNDGVTVIEGFSVVAPEAKIVSVLQPDEFELTVAVGVVAKVPDVAVTVAPENTAVPTVGQASVRVM